MNRTIKENDYVQLNKVIGDVAGDFEHAIGKVYQVKKVVERKHMKPREYGLNIDGHGLCYFTDSEVELAM